MHRLFPMLALGCLARTVTPNIAEVSPQARQALTPQQFQLGGGDTIAINVWRHDDLNMEVTIAPDGSITYPLIGRMVVAGMTYSQLRDALTAAISEYYENPQVSVNIVKLQSQKVFVLGDGVATPSVLHLETELSILEALTMSGGISPSAKTNNVLLVRTGPDEPQLFTIDVAAIYTTGQMDQMVYLQRGDIVLVPNRTITDVANTFREIQSLIGPLMSGSAIYRNLSVGAGPDASVE